MDLRAIALNIYQKSLTSQNDDADIEGLSSQDKAFVKRLVLTALRKHEYLKKVMRKYMTKKLPQKLGLTHYAIILGAVEILYFRTPDYAVLDSYVDIVKKQENKFTSGFVNAVLRKITKDRDIIIQQEQPTWFPKTFTEMLQKSYTNKEISQIEKASANEPPLDITVKDEPEKWAKTLDGKLMGNGSIRLFSAGLIPELEGFESGDWWVQDLASSLAVKALDDITGKNVLDLCAAPGGKTAQLINAGGKVSALDISDIRLDRLEENLKRLNMNPETVITANALDYLKETDEEYDVIVIDAPCSATGTLRRHPEIAHTKNLSDIRKSADIQRTMLHLASKKLKVGGTIIYATCSLSKAEGEKQIKDFIDSHDNFKIVPITIEKINPYKQPELNDLITSEGYIRCLPSHLNSDGGLDGFFVAKLKKES